MITNVDNKNAEKYRAIYSESRKECKFCIHCGQVATKIAYYNIEGAVILEKYCDKCAKVIEDSSPK
jgi:flavoprotein